MEDVLLTVEEAAMYLSVTVQTLRKYIHKGEIVAYRINRNYRVSGESINEFLKKRCIGERI